MKICVLDGYTLNPGDLSWDAVCSLGECSVYDRTATADEVVDRAADAEIVLTNKVMITDDVMERLPALRYVGVLATGYNVVDIEAARRRGIIVTNIPAYSTASVAQMVFAHLLNITNSVARYSAEIGQWARSRDFCYYDSGLTELAGKTMGIVGLGNTGMATARIALAFGMKVIALTSKTADVLPEGIVPVDRDTLMAEADVISLHCPLTESTREIINARSIAMMRPGVIVINTGRGPLVAEADVAEALRSRRIAAYAADVLSVEPPSSDNPLLNVERAYITPHIAWATIEARRRLMTIAAKNISAFINNNPINVVNK
ncbi:MAG: D-2-hydroxyacid dehydrogenase [Candidatus Limisoma sp.]|nr:D-2-hydroxyacid dehydrogenase [Candidatus Limisoma sp.]